MRSLHLPLPVRVLLTALLLIPALTACGGSANTPQAIAQRFADAVVREDYKAARALFDPTLSESEVTTLIVRVRGDMVDHYGSLRSASARPPEPNSKETEALVLVNWQLAQADVANGWVLKKTDKNGWQIMTVWPFGQEVGRLQSSGIIATMTPAPTPQPTARDLNVSANVPIANGVRPNMDGTITLVETGAQQIGTSAYFRQLPLGTYTVRLEIAGREPSEAKITIQGDQAPPDPLVIDLGAPLPFDTTNNIFITSAPPSSTAWSQFTLNTLGPNGLTPHWSVESYMPPVLDATGMTMRFVGPKGIGSIDASGLITWLWQPPTSVRDWIYRPDSSEIAYVENRDLWTVATTPDASPTRWSKLGIFTKVLGWADTDTLLLQTEQDVRMMRRDGESYHVADSLTFGPTLLRDWAGVIRMINDGKHLLRPGSAAMEPLPARSEVMANSQSYGWTRDNRFYLVHSLADTQGPTSGIFIIGADGSARQVLPELTGHVELFTRFLDDRGDPIFAPSTSHMALIWAGKEHAGIYLIDAEAGNAHQVSDVTPDTLFWANESTLIYVINAGDAMGTWLQPLDGQPARKLFAYRAQQVGPTPDGGIVLVANETLWRVNGSGEPALLGAEGTFRTTIYPSLITSAAAANVPAANKPVAIVPPAPTAQANATTATAVIATTPAPLANPAPIQPAIAFAWEEAPAGQDSTGKPVVYTADQTIDGRMDTTWRVPGDGVGQSVVLTFDRAVRLSEVRIVPGYAKIDQASGENRFLQNRRVRRVRLEFSGKRSIEADLAERPELQAIPFDSVVTSYVRIVVLATTAPGATGGRDFTPISEIVPVGQECLAGQCGVAGDDISALMSVAGGAGLAVQVEALDGDYARLELLPLDRKLDPLTAFYKRTNGIWEWVSAGTAFDPDSLTGLGLPKSVWP